jgi:hypothetical protein
MHTEFWWGDLRGRDHLQDLRVDSKMNVHAVGWGDIDWVDLAQDEDRWRAVVNTVMNLRVP